MKYILFRSEGSLNQHIKLKHPEHYQTMIANNPSLPCLSKKDSTFNNNENRSLNSESNYDREDDDEVNIMTEEEDNDDDDDAGHYS